jgi:hypothetical protein
VPCVTVALRSGQSMGFEASPHSGASPQPVRCSTPFPRRIGARRYGAPDSRDGPLQTKTSLPVTPPLAEQLVRLSCLGKRKSPGDERLDPLLSNRRPGVDRHVSWTTQPDVASVRASAVVGLRLVRTRGVWVSRHAASGQEVDVRALPDATPSIRRRGAAHHQPETDTPRVPGNQPLSRCGARSAGPPGPRAAPARNSQAPPRPLAPPSPTRRSAHPSPRGRRAGSRALSTPPG